MVEALLDSKMAQQQPLHQQQHNLSGGGRGGGKRGVGFSALHAAARAGNTETVKALLRHGGGFRVHAVTDSRMVPAHFAAASGHAETLRFLLGAGTASSIRDVNSQGLLHHAARAGQVDVCKLILEEHQGDVRQWDRWHRTPLHWAVICGSGAAVQLLLDAGSDPNFKVCCPLFSLSPHHRAMSTVGLRHLILLTPLHVLTVVLTSLPRFSWFRSERELMPSARR